jgi:acyl carrier protein
VTAGGSRSAARTAEPGPPAEPGAVADRGRADNALVAQIAALLREVTGEDEQWLAALGPHTRLDADLLLESVELAELGDALARRYGEQVDLVAHVATLELDQIIALTIADVAGYVDSAGGRR